MLKYPEGTACAAVLDGRRLGGGLAAQASPAAQAEMRAAEAAGLGKPGRQRHLHRLRHRPALQDRSTWPLKAVEGRAREGLRRAVQGRPR